MCVCVCVCVCVCCPQTQLMSQYFLPPLPVTKTVCPSICPERCFDFEGSKFCCNTICVAGCSGTTGSDCVVSVKGGGTRVKGGLGIPFWFNPNVLRYIHCTAWSSCQSSLPAVQ